MVEILLKYGKWLTNIYTLTLRTVNFVYELKVFTLNLKREILTFNVGITLH